MSNYKILFPFISYGIALLFQLRILNLLKKTKFDYYQTHIIFYFPLFLMGMLNTDRSALKTVNFQVIIGTILLSSFITFLFNLLDTKNVTVCVSQLDNKNFLYRILLIIYYVISEELFFRVYILTELSFIGNYYSIMITSILFVFLHIFSSRSNLRYKWYSYAAQLIMSIIWCALMVYTENIIYSIISHLIFNFSLFYELYVLKKYNKDCSGNFFNDYE